MVAHQQLQSGPLEERQHQNTAEAVDTRDAHRYARGRRHVKGRSHRQRHRRQQQEGKTGTEKRPRVGERGERWMTAWEVAPPLDAPEFLQYPSGRAPRGHEPAASTPGHRARPHDGHGGSGAAPPPPTAGRHPLTG